MMDGDWRWLYLCLQILHVLQILQILQIPGYANM